MYGIVISQSDGGFIAHFDVIQNTLAVFAREVTRNNHLRCRADGVDRLLYGYAVDADVFTEKTDASEGYFGFGYN